MIHNANTKLRCGAYNENLFFHLPGAEHVDVSYLQLVPQDDTTLGKFARYNAGCEIELCAMIKSRCVVEKFSSVGAYPLRLNCWHLRAKRDKCLIK